MIITAHDLATAQRSRTKTQTVQHKYSGGIITASEIARRIGVHRDTVYKRLRNESPDQILATGRIKPGRAGHKK